MEAISIQERFWLRLKWRFIAPVGKRLGLWAALENLGYTGKRYHARHVTDGCAMPYWWQCGHPVCRRANWIWGVGRDLGGLG